MDFIINIPENAALFRGISDRNNIISNWFCLNLSDTDQYGSRKFVFKANKNLRLIDLTNIKFHDDYLSKVNNLFGNNIDKLYYLIPIGLPDYDTQIKFLESKQFPIPQINRQLSDENNILLNCLQNKSRYSEYNIDKTFVDILKQLYGTETDGYIIPRPWPTKIGNALFMPEIYVYNTDDISLLQELPPQSGGRNLELSLNSINLSINNNLKMKSTNEKILSNKEDSITPIWVQKMHESLSNFKQPTIDKNIIMTGWNKHNITEEQKAEMEKISELTRKLIADAVANPPYITIDKFMKKSLFGGKTRKRKNK